MSDEKKKDIENTVEVLKQLDEKSLLLVSSGAKLLAARQQMENEQDK